MLGFAQGSDRGWENQEDFPERSPEGGRWEQERCWEQREQQAQRLRGIKATALFSFYVPGPGWSLDCGESDESIEDPAVSLRREADVPDSHRGLSGVPILLPPSEKGEPQQKGTQFDSPPPRGPSKSLG